MKKVFIFSIRYRHESHDHLPGRKCYATFEMAELALLAYAKENFKQGPTSKMIHWNGPFGTFVFEHCNGYVYHLEVKE